MARSASDRAPGLAGFVATAADDYMTTPVPYVGSELVHPDVVHLSTPWNGYAYWMAVTPYPNGDSRYENPSVYASNDGRSWTTPPGASNPVVPYPGSWAYNRDPDLVDGRDGRLYLFWSYTGGGRVYLAYTSSSDGLHWSEPLTTLDTDRSVEFLTSPALLFDGAGWTLYYVDARETETKAIKVRTAVSPAGPWSEPTALSIPSPAPGKEFWHLDAERFDGRTILLLDIADAHSYGVAGDLYFAWSIDGLSFTLAPCPVVARTCGWNTSLYRASFVPLADGPETRFAIWYSAHGDGWHLGYTEAQRE